MTAPSGFALANGGERVAFERDGSTVDDVQYEDAPEGEQWRPNQTPSWRPLDLTTRSVHVSGATFANAFVLPDAPGPPVQTLRDADRRILLAGYTLSSRRVARALVEAADRGVTVRVLIDDAPVGGMSPRQASVLDRLVANGVAVTVVGDGPRARYDYHHPKYAVVDRRALVMTENWKPSGTGGHSSRGWGVRVDSAATADELVTVFRTDATGRARRRDVRSVQGRRSTTVRVGPHDDDTDASPTATSKTYPTRFDPTTAAVNEIRLVTSPSNAESAVVDVIDDASDNVSVVQPTIGSRRLPFLRAALRAAERGVEVHILLSGAWYVEEENRHLVAWVNERASRRNLPLEARVDDPGGRFEKIHAKDVVADDTVVVGSVNWNNNSVRENREVAVVLTGAEPARYYREVFSADWRGGRSRVPVGVVVAAALAVLGGVGVARWRIEFDVEGD